VSFVPNASNATITSAKLEYLLVKNTGKAKFFRLFGFDPARPQELERALRWHVRNRHYDRDMPTAHGVKYEVKCSAPSPDGRDPCILSIWIIDAGQMVPRFVTAYGNPSLGIASRA
jgi:hypothetical protein